MSRVWLAVVNVVALVVWILSWMLPVNIALPQGMYTMPSRWDLFVLQMKAQPGLATVPLVLCRDVALLVRALRRS